MAGVPNLGGVFGTYSSQGGMDLTPALAALRNRQFLQQLEEERRRAESQNALATRELDLRQRGQDIGVEQSGLERTFQQNLMKMRQDFDAAQQQRQIEAATAQQQRQIQEMQRSQQASQQFQGEQAGLEREFRGVEGEADRALRREGMAMQNAQFAESLGFEREKFGFGREIELRNQSRADRAEQLNMEMAELDKQYKSGQISMQQAQTAMITKQIEVLGMEMRDALEDKGLSDETFAKIADAMAKGEDLPPEIAGAVLKSPKAMRAMLGLSELLSAAQERGLIREAQKAKEASTETPAEDTSKLTKQESDLRESFQRKVDAQGVLDTDIGQSSPAEVGIVALNALEGLAGQESEEAVSLRKSLREVVELVRKIKGGAIGGLFNDTTDRTGRLSVEGLSDEELDRLDELILSLKENGIELVD